MSAEISGLLGGAGYLPIAVICGLIVLEADRLRRGAPAVFVGRITPGLRVVTTEASGLISIPRRTFVKELLPAGALYEAIFLGLGAWLGREAWRTIERYGPKPGQLIVLM